MRADRSTWAHRVIAVAVLFASGSGLVADPVTAADEVPVVAVTTTADVVDADDGVVSLREAIDRANAADGPVVIELAPQATYELTTCDGTRASEDDTNTSGDLDHTSHHPLTVRNGGTIEQACGADSGERVLDGHGALLEVDGVVITGGDSSGDGGGIRAEALHLDGSVTANRADGSGGGIAVTGPAPARIVSSGFTFTTVTENEAGVDGGGIWSPSGVDLSMVRVRGNRAGNDGGGIAGGPTWLEGTGVHQNVAGRDGGGFAVTELDHPDTFNGSSSANGNLAGRDGGGAHVTGTLVGKGFGAADNLAGRDGGGLWAAEIALGFENLGDVAHNLAGRDGGGLFATGDVSLDGDLVAGNTAARNGGGAFVGGDLASETGVDDGARLEGNSAAGGGGGGAFVAGSLTARGGSVTGNRARVGGGLLTGGDVDVDRLDLRRNVATIGAVVEGAGLPAPSGSGGGLFAAGTGDVALRNAAVVGNIASRDGEAGGGLQLQAPGNHLLQFVTLVQNGSNSALDLWTGPGADVTVAASVFSSSETWGYSSRGNCRLALPLSAPDPATAPPLLRGEQPSYATDDSCALPGTRSTNDGADPLLDEEGRPHLRSPLLGAVVLPAGTHLADTEARHRPEGPGSDIGAFEVDEPTYTPITPIRVLDTRRPDDGAAPLGPNEQRFVELGRERPPEAVVVNLTAVAPTAETHLSFGAGTSSLNVAAGSTRAVAAVVPVSPSHGGRFVVRNQSGRTHVLIDVVGVVESSSEGLSTVTVPPLRVADTRRSSAIGAGETRTLDLVGASAPPDVEAVVVNLTATGASAPTHLTAWAHGTPRPATSTLNLPAGDTVANLATVAVDAEGRADIRNSSGSVHVVADVVAYLVDAPHDSPLAPELSGHHVVAPHRVLDTRTPAGGAAPIAAGTVRTVDVVDVRRSVPEHARAVIANLTVVTPSSAAHLTAWALGAVKPGTSNLNAPEGVTRNNLAIVPLGPGGTIDLALSAGQAHVLVDVVGYLA